MNDRKVLEGREKLLHVFVFVLMNQHRRNVSEAEVSAQETLDKTPDKDVFTQLEFYGYQWNGLAWIPTT